ncbi:AAA family ATPase [Methanolobus halotolerans]|uniref:AAA family ATPase n=1 Tax=Methanolobus halotolerans TaxID=2052935 RepID=A0A4E0QQV9_9EURY|nr:AAA family ATPase [Methanolobus halotolerans]TGC08360.1 AAA family ATPase [Methanolobus halotolerans]
MIFIVRTVQKVNTKVIRDPSKNPVESTAEFLVLEPAGYPMASVLEEYPEIENPGVFEHYAREQWDGFVARKGEYLFDKRMYPDFAYRITEVQPCESVIGLKTKIIVKDLVVSSAPTVEFTSDVFFDDVIGQHSARRKCRLIERFLEQPEMFGRWAPRNVLFFGPSGTGKTMFAKALANKTHVPILPVKATELIGEFVGEGARQIHQLYERAQEMAPCIIFIDELDAIALDRRHQELRGDVAEIVNSLLTEMDGIVERPGICTIGATNRNDTIDPAVRSRFEEEIEFTLPDENERLAILESNIKTFPIPVKDVNLKVIAKMTKGLSGRDLVGKVLKTALHNVIIEDRENVTQDDLRTSVKKIMKVQTKLDPESLYI